MARIGDKISQRCLKSIEEFFDEDKDYHATGSTGSSPRRLRFGDETWDRLGLELEAIRDDLGAGTIDPLGCIANRVFARRRRESETLSRWSGTETRNEQDREGPNC